MARLPCIGAEPVNLATLFALASRAGCCCAQWIKRYRNKLVNSISGTTFRIQWYASQAWPRICRRARFASRSARGFGGRYPA